MHMEYIPSTLQLALTGLLSKIDLVQSQTWNLEYGDVAMAPCHSTTSPSSIFFP